MMGRETVPSLHVRCLLRPDGFGRVSNPGFEVDAAGWSVSAGVNGAGTSITRLAVDPASGTSCAELITTATAGSGCNFDLGSERYWQESACGTAYAALVWLRRVSGPARARLVLGSEGTPADRATLVITDLADEWTPYRVTWYPTAHRTDAQLAITNDAAALLGVRIDQARVWQVDAFSQVENGNLLTDTTGWAVTASLNAAGTSLTRQATGGYVAPSCARLVTTATDGSGCNYRVRSREFVAGRTYRVRAALRRVSGGTTARLRLGSYATSGSRSSSAPVAISGSWAWYAADVTMSATCTDMEVTVTNGAAEALTVDVSGLEVYEAHDELSGDAGRADVSALDWTRPTGGVGTLSMTLHDPADARRYTPWDASGPLYGLLDTGRRVWVRAAYGAGVHALWYGTVRRWVPDRDTGTCVAMAEDPMSDLAAARVAVGFADDRSYRDARAALFGAGAIAAGRDPVAGDARLSLSTAAIEAGTFYDGTDGEVPALDYLADLDDATGTVASIAPSNVAEYLWRYRTVSRTDLTDVTGAVSVGDTILAALRDTDLSDEGVETTWSVGWQAYERAALAGTLLAQARDPGSYADVDADDPYLHFTRDDVASDEDVPAPTYEREPGWRWRVVVRKGRRRRRVRRRVRVRTYRFRRVYPDAFVPFSLAAATERAWDMSFSMPVVVDGVTTAHPSATPATVAWSADGPRRVSFRATAAGASTTGSVRVTGAAWLPLDDATHERTDAEAALARGLRPGPTTDTPYVPALAAAEGLARYRQWRWREPRMRPTLVHEHGSWSTMLPLRQCDRVTVAADRYALPPTTLVVTSVTGSVSGGGLSWSLSYALEALPASLGTPFTLDSSALDGSHVLAH